MTREEIRIGETYLLPVVATEFSDYGVRVVTADDGEVLFVHPEALAKVKTEIDMIPIKKGGNNGKYSRIPVSVQR